MRIKDAQIGSKIICCGTIAEVLKHGPMGTCVKVLSVKIDKGDNSGMTLGSQVWSSLTECTLHTQGTGKAALSTQVGAMLPITLF